MLKAHYIIIMTKIVMILMIVIINNYNDKNSDAKLILN